ncbi:Tetratricopeptide repeat protein [Rubripirellula tenax]|uniref:Tetratricopeptide repeat protein n=1 Tax=Rubripirellula tenax TaxID=2528015 RepID=A0A5C6EP86_9BACT|nr:tetratricopeptide repeat protein [Rubripirellula tenax]TWU50892.1 Tetratricopeptide repeat protein [Rubripirellula tenax]
MAATPKPDDSAATPARPSDKVTTMLMMGAALAAIGGFAVLFSLWWRSGVTDSYEILRIAAQEFVAGRPILAGELAETVRFAGEIDKPDANAEEQAPPEGEAPPEPELPPNDPDAEPTAEEIAAAEEAERFQEWVRLRDFLVGAGKVAKAQALADFRERRQQLIEAAAALAAAQKSGFPAGRQTEGHRMLGEAYFQLGRYADAAETLSEAVRLDPTLRRPLLPTIAESQLRTRGPSIEPALATIEEHIADGSLNVQQAWAAELIRLRALVELKRYAQAKEGITTALSKPANPDVLLQAEEADFRDEVRLLAAIINVQQATTRYGAMPNDPSENRSQAITDLADTMNTLGELQREAPPKTSAMARLWLARSFLIQGELDEGLSHLTSVRGQRPFAAEGILGGLEEIELLAHQGRGVEVLQTTRYMMREIGDESGFDADAVTFDEFKRRMFSAIEALRQTGDFANAIDTARSLPPLFDKADALMQEAVGYSEWADATLREGTNVSGQVVRAASILARSRYRASGDAYAQAAELKFDTEQYVSAQWSAIEAYQKGRHFRRSVRLLEPYLRYEQRTRQPRGLVAYGRALLAEGDENKAIAALEECIVEYPRDPLRYDARLLIAQAHAERREPEKAIKYLMDNLRDGELTPQSPAWRDSLIQLGEMRYEEAFRNHLAAEQGTPAQRIELMRQNQPILEEAIRYLEQSVERYGIPNALNAAYLAARAHSLAADWPRIEAESPEILDAAKRSLRAQADQELQVALNSFIDLRTDLAAREEELRLPFNEEAILRNCFLAEAETLKRMNRFDDAATAYRTIELRYMNEPTALEAILGRAACMNEMGRPDESNLLVRQASIVLGRIPNEWNDRFAETTRFDRLGWEQYLAWMNTRIENGGV